MPDTVSGIGFAVLGLAVLGGAVGMLSSKNVVHAAYWLLEVSVAAAGIYWLLDSEYVALVQLLVYAGAVAILLIFTIMITMRRREDAIRNRDFSWLAALMAAAFFGLVAFAVLGTEFAPVAMPDAAPDLVALGKLLFSLEGWVLPFEIASLVLTAALVAAVWWSREGDDE